MTAVATRARNVRLRRWAVVAALLMALGALANAIDAPSLAHLLMAVGFAGLAIVAALEAWRVRRRT